MVGVTAVFNDATSVIVHVLETETGEVLRSRVGEKMGIDPMRIDMIYGGYRLRDEEFLNEHMDLPDLTCIHCIVKDPVQPAVPVQPADPVARVVKLEFQFPTGDKRPMEISSDEPFAEIKNRLATDPDSARCLQKAGLNRADQLCLKFRQETLQDCETSRSRNFHDASKIHVVWNSSPDILAEPINKDTLWFNCRYCLQAGVKLELRARCADCKFGGIDVKGATDMDGTKNWEHLVGCEGECLACGKNKRADIGFRCMSLDKKARRCPGCDESSDKTVAFMDTSTRDSMLEVLYALLSYPDLDGY